VRASQKISVTSEAPRSPLAGLELSADTDAASRRLRAALDQISVRWPFPEDKRCDVLLDGGERAVFTVGVRSGRVVISEGRAARPVTTVHADAVTLSEVLEGARSGLETWLKGYIRVRGSVAHAMKLEALIDATRRPSTFARPSRVIAHGIDTFYLEAGHGPAVVLLHGLGGTNASMLPTLSALSGRYRVIAPDAPGFGESAKPLRPYHAGFFAKWAMALLDALGIERAHFVGNSMGGRISIEVALRSPERVDRLALLAPAVAFRRLRQLVPFVRLLRPEFAVVPTIPPRATVLAATRQLFSQHDRLPPSWYDAATDEFLRVFATTRGRIAFFSAARQIYLDEPWGDRGFWKRLRSLERPALFIWGDRDLLVPKGFARHVTECVPHAQSVVLPDCGHVPQYELPEQTHDRILDFLQR
jgi:pimeloyl-ACP methyl ester carboxylesterase